MTATDADSVSSNGVASGLRVLFLNHSVQISGAEQSLRAMLWQLRRSSAGVEAVVALPQAGPFSELLRDEGWSVTLAPLRRLNRPRGVAGTAGLLWYVLRTLPHITRLIHGTQSQLVHSNSTTAHLVGGMAAERCGRPSIWHVRDLVSLQGLGSALSSRASAVVAISGTVAEHLQREGVPGEKIRIIYNGLDPDEWRPRPISNLRESLNLPAEALVFGCVTQLVPWKNHADFINAAHQIVEKSPGRRLHFLMVGSDLWQEHGDYVNGLKDQVRTLGLQSCFNFVPHQQDAMDAISALDCLVLPSLQEPFGRVIIEAMALGKPAIAYAAHGPQEIITHEQDGLLVRPDGPDGLTAAMLRLVEDDELRSNMAAHCRETVKKRFHIAGTMEQMLALYKELT